ncbi:VOC family protein [Paraburkholderia sp. BL25I1N1]|uniref:VOC family protein n=1 Tax=Paraburkholderia sp. BL25I1N1 TaxID=1938804 RepID=UPI000D4ADBEA|nr:VOC family protein [Paraburkholderia sp. BL25I1N1]PRX92111.1 catechol 2,3-dioxygenase-like lactoylglutathione lyase family enzyme [Paraburkholderia sp. BL25I1N1]
MQQTSTVGTTKLDEPDLNRLKLRGVHHLALNTEDIKTTIDFYVEVLGMPLIHAMKIPAGVDRGNPPFQRIRHYFFDMGNDSLLAFFELPKGAKEKADRNSVAAMQHVSFSISPSQVDKLMSRLVDAGIDHMGPLESAPGTYSIYFYDPNGIRLEVSYQNCGGDQHVIAHFRMSRDQLLTELRTVTADEAWLARIAGI